MTHKISLTPDLMRLSKKFESLLEKNPNLVTNKNSRNENLIKSIKSHKNNVTTKTSPPQVIDYMDLISIIKDDLVKYSNGNPRNLRQIKS